MLRLVLSYTCYLSLIWIFFSCQPSTPAHQTMESSTPPRSQEMPAFPNDAHSFARPNQAAVRHLSLSLVVDFETQQLQGIATWQVEAQPGAVLFLDTYALTIQKVTDGKGMPLAFMLHEAIPHLGSALEITLGDTESVSIHYTTAPDAPAIQWLTPAQTAGKRHPFMFTQSQAILARSWVPCQDSPGVRFTYNAEVRVPVQLLPLMSAENPQQRNEEGTYQFKMEQPIPSYLLALAVGDLQFQPLGERTGVYAEPSTLPKAAYELAETEQMLLAAEKLYGPYQWGRYDVLMLPPSFPFGGMENPRLTFATPTILAGDRSLVSLVAHELAHSWSGNLVTNATWNDFWLNEGFTVYFELRIMEEVYGEDFADMLALVGYQDLQATLTSMDYSEDTQLKLNLEGRNPDDGMTSIAYDKGYFFLRLIEEKVGRKWWDKFLQEYFETYAFRSVTTESFLDFLQNRLLYKYNTATEEIQIEKWVYRAGLPENCPNIVSGRFQQVDSVRHAFLTKGWITQQEWAYQEWVYFLRELPHPLSYAKMEILDQQFQLSSSGNSEILFEWLMLCISSKYAPAYPQLTKFLSQVGRRKFIAPLYREMMKQPTLQSLAKRTYQNARPNYHFVSTQTIDKIMQAHHPQTSSN